MGWPEWIAVLSVVTALASLAVEQHLTRIQNNDEAKARHYDRAQTLILRALDDPGLLEAISGTSDENQKHRRYRQLWFNHVEMIFRQRRFFDRQHWQGTLNDIRSFMNMPAMRDHWGSHGHYYAGDFRRFMDRDILGIVAEAPLAGAPPIAD
ncbi:DUF6082 family protein [Luteolibacter sp. Populi]|uniref:DUF6082 family protein n=1 Tax=Luteolibacter sp. Populi TaxID=3230487 RepID=UPI003467BE31